MEILCERENLNRESELILLDNNATTAVDPYVIDYICCTMKKLAGNPSSIHEAGKQASKYINYARQSILKNLGGSDTGFIIFTSGATESNNLIILGLSEAFSNDPDSCFVTTPIEHPSVYKSFEKIKQKKLHKVKYLKVEKKTGRIDIDNLITIINNEKVVFVSVNYANHEIGTIQDIGKIAKICHEKGAFLHIDATQAVGKIPIDIKRLEIDYLSLSAHKFFGPKGIGALYISYNAPKPEPIMFGGDQEFFFRPGTHNVFGILGMAMALNLLVPNLPTIIKEEQNLKDYLLYKIEKLRQENLIPQYSINGDITFSLPGTISISFLNTDASDLVLFMSSNGICISKGSACKTQSKKASNVLKAIKLTPDEAEGTIRIGLSPKNTLQHIDKFITILERYYNLKSDSFKNK